MSSSANAAAGSSSTASKAQASPTQVDAELEKLLSREASAFQREVEVERILKAFKLKWAIYVHLTLYGYFIELYSVHTISWIWTKPQLKKISRKSTGNYRYVRLNPIHIYLPSYSSKIASQSSIRIRHLMLVLPRPLTSSRKQNPSFQTNLSETI